MKSYYIYQDGSIPGTKLIEALENRGGKNNGRFTGENKGLIYTIDPNSHLIETEIPSGYYSSSLNNGERCELVYDEKTGEFIENATYMYPDRNYVIPEGYELIEVGEGIYKLSKIKWRPDLGEEYWFCSLDPDEETFCTEQKDTWDSTETERTWLNLGLIFKTEETCKQVCKELNASLKNILEKHQYDN